MRHTTFLFWTCHCEQHPYHRQHENQCVRCDDFRDVHYSDIEPGANIAELLQWHLYALTPEEICAFKRVGTVRSDEIWMLIMSDGGIYSVMASKSMLEVEEEYIRRAIGAEAPWNEKTMDYDWSAASCIYAVIGINTTTMEAI